jgi:hypothetical protein
MFDHRMLVFVCLLGTALVSSCALGEIGDEVGEARLGPESGTFDGGVELSPEAAAEFSEDPVPGVVERSAPETPNTAMQPEEPIASACSSAAPDLSAIDGWRTTQASQAAFDTLRFEFMARPAAANLNGLVAVGAQNIDEFSDAAISVRFTGSGLIDARDGSAYASDTLFVYDPGVWYQISISADITARTYDVAVGRCGEPTQALITGAAFRSDASVSNPLTTWGLWSSQSALIELSTPMWIASGSCAPATCQSLGSECGQPSDGCNGTLSCGDCSGGQMCSSGVCIDAPVSPPPPPDCVPATCQSLGSECGQPSDGCGGRLNCGGCASGEACASGACVADSGKPTAANTGCAGYEAISPGACARIPSSPDTNCSDFGTPGVYEDFYCKGGTLDVNVSGVTLRNFRHDGDGSLYGVRIQPGVTGTVIEYGEIWNGHSTNLYDKGNDTTVRYIYMHHSKKDVMKADGDGGLFEYNFGEKGGAGDGSHADWMQMVSGTNYEFRFNNCDMPKPGTPEHEAYPTDTNPPYIFPGPPYRSNACFILHDDTDNIYIHDNWLTGGNYTIYGNPGTTVRNNIFGRENADHPSLSSCTNCNGSSRLCNGPFDDWSGNVWEDNGTEAGNNSSCD